MFVKEVEEGYEMKEAAREEGERDMRRVHKDVA